MVKHRHEAGPSRVRFKSEINTEIIIEWEAARLFYGFDLVAREQRDLKILPVAA